MGDPDRWRRARELFDRVLDLEAGERKAFLDEACEGDRELRTLLDRLVAEASAEGGGGPITPLDAGIPADLVGRAVKPRTLVDQEIGDFRILDTLGSGGMATVFTARQGHPPRTVALKVMRWGLLSESARRRFTYESQVLGSLSHPGIAQVYAAGTFQDRWSGQELPYFAMELVEGAVPLTLFAKERNLDLEAVLRLFLQVCTAVDHGHQRGIIHRDLKPQNILVDRSGRPKIIDFGIARATGAGAGERTLQTGAGEILGTLAYMSPEQVEGEGADLDLRADVYALGVILYELLVGQPPFDFRNTPVTTAIRTIQESPPPRPSQAGPASTREGRLAELDWIILKALDKDRERRYPAVSALAADLTRLLAHEPVLARPPSRLYLAGKFIRRHRLPVAGAATGLVLLLVAFAVVVLSLAQARREVATRQAINDFLVEMLSAVSPYQEGREVKVLDLVDRAAARADRLHGDHPRLLSPLRTTLGGVYFALGLHRKALDQFTKGLAIDRKLHGEDHPRTLLAISNIAACHLGLGDAAKAQELADRSLAGRRQVLAPDHPELAVTLMILAQIDFQADRFDLAAQRYRRAWEILKRQEVPNPRLQLQAGSGLGFTLIKLGRDGEGERVLRRSIDEGNRELTADHPSVLSARGNLALLLFKQDRLEAAASLFQQVLEAQDRTLGRIHHVTLVTLSNLAACQKRLDRAGAAAATYREVLARRREAGLYRHLQTAIALGNLGVCLEVQDELAAAEKSFTESLALLKACKVPTDHWLAASFRKGLAVVRGKQERYPQAETMLLDCLRIFTTARGDHRRRIRLAREALINVYERWGRPEQAAAVRGKL